LKEAKTEGINILSIEIQTIRCGRDWGRMKDKIMLSFKRGRKKFSY
jgi:hypothetical protein